MNDKSGDKFDDDDQMSLENEEDAVEKGCEDDENSIYDIDDINQLDGSDTDNSKTEESPGEDANSYKAKNFRWSKVPPRVSRTRRENIIVRPPGCQSQARN